MDVDAETKEAETAVTCGEGGAETEERVGAASGGSVTLVLRRGDGVALSILLRDYLGILQKYHEDHCKIDL
jgi:hypothetical protein